MKRRQHITVSLTDRERVLLMLAPDNNYEIGALDEGTVNAVLSSLYEDGSAAHQNLKGVWLTQRGLVELARLKRRIRNHRWHEPAQLLLCFALTAIVIVVEQYVPWTTAFMLPGMTGMLLGISEFIHKVRRRWTVPIGIGMLLTFGFPPDWRNLMAAALAFGYVLLISRLANRLLPVT